MTYGPDPDRQHRCQTATTKSFSEAGYDRAMGDGDHFVSWLRLFRTIASAVQVIGKGRLPTNNPVSIALKMAPAPATKQNLSGMKHLVRCRTSEELHCHQGHGGQAARLSKKKKNRCCATDEIRDQGALYEAQHGNYRSSSSSGKPPSRISTSSKPGRRTTRSFLRSTGQRFALLFMRLKTAARDWRTMALSDYNPEAQPGSTAKAAFSLEASCR